jgi:hypothetical protein
MDPVDLKRRILTIRSQLAKHRASLVLGEGLQLALDRSDAWSDTAISTAASHQAASLEQAEAMAAVFVLAETLQLCSQAGLPIGPHLKEYDDW